MSGLIAGGGFNLGAHDSVQQQHNLPVLPVQWHPKHPLRCCVCPYLLRGVPGWSHCGWAAGEEDWQVKHPHHDLDSLDCGWDHPVSWFWRHTSIQ